MFIRRKIALPISLLGFVVLSAGGTNASDITSLFKWSVNISEEHAKVGIVPKDDEETSYRGVMLTCDASNFSAHVGPINISEIAKKPKFEQSPSMVFRVDGKLLDFGLPSLVYNEMDSVWEYVVSQPFDQGLSEAISNARSISVSGVGLSMRLPINGQKQVGEFGRACRSRQAKQAACDLERSLRGEFRLGRVTDWAYASDPGVTSFILRSSKRGTDGTIQSAIALELIENRMGYGVFSADGKDLGVMALSEATISDPAKRGCPKLTTKFENPSRLAILRDGQRIGVIIDEQQLLSRRGM